MKITRVEYRGMVYFALIQKGQYYLIDGKPYDGCVCLNGICIPQHEARALVPCTPTKIIGVGLNYRGHSEELGMVQTKDPVIFLKPVSALVKSGDAIVKPPGIGRMDYEAELGIVIGKPCRNVSVEEAKKYIFGYTCVNDVTARDIQSIDGQWTRAKGFDTFAPVGPWIETEVEPVPLKLFARVDGRVRQKGNTADMIHSPYELVSFISRVMSLYPGDVIATGSPVGVGEVLPGQVVQIEIENIGVLENFCIEGE